MSLLNWSDPETHWLIVTNIILGLVVVLCVAIMAGGMVHEVIARLRKRRRVSAEIDRDMQMLNDDHAFHVPGLGITMADGGEKHEK
ncbi:MAG: hypothetical protein ABSH50_10535 [Bryobacteraceae bacterium]